MDWTYRLSGRGAAHNKRKKDARHLCISCSLHCLCPPPRCFATFIAGKGNDFLSHHVRRHWRLSPTDTAVIFGRYAFSSNHRKVSLTNLRYASRNQVGVVVIDIRDLSRVPLLYRFQRYNVSHVVLLSIRKIQIAYSFHTSFLRFSFSPTAPNKGNHDEAQSKRLRDCLGR